MLVLEGEGLQHDFFYCGKIHVTIKFTILNCTVSGIKYIVRPCGIFFYSQAASTWPGIEAEST